MACADVDMDIHGAEEPGGADCNEAPDSWCFRPLEMTPESKSSLHNVLQKQPAVFGVRKPTSITVSAHRGFVSVTGPQPSQPLTLSRL